MNIGTACETIVATNDHSKMIKFCGLTCGRKNQRVHLRGLPVEPRLCQTFRGERNIARKIRQTRQHKRAALGLPSRRVREINHIAALQHAHIYKRAHVLQLALHFCVKLRKIFPRARHAGTVVKNF